MKIAIGIDPGTETGIAVWDIDKQKLSYVSKDTIHRVMRDFQAWKEIESIEIQKVRVEDSRKRKWYGKNANAKKKGAGSVERDCKIWEDFLKDEGIPFELVHPITGATKWSQEYFKKITGWQKRTNQDARDAAMLVFGL